MKKALFFAISGFCVAVLLPVSSVTAAKVEIIVPDAGFEDHALNAVGAWIYLGDAGYTGAWKNLLPGGAAWVDYGYWEAQGDLNLLARSGNNKLYATYPEGIEDYVYQILDDTFIEGATYTLSVWVGIAWSGRPDGWSLKFTGEDHADDLSEISGSAPVGSWEQVSLDYTATATDAGKKIGIKMETTAEFVTFDDVTLSYLIPTLAGNSNPANEQADVPRDVVLSWQPAESSAPTNGQIVYFGETFDGVNDATGGIAQTAASHAPAQGLDFGKTYYWRVDAVDGATVHKGDVWNFTIEPFSIPITDITVQADSFGVSVPEKTIDGSGLVGDLHGIIAGDMWISAGIPATIEYAFDRAYKLHELWIWNANQPIEAFVGFGAKDVVIEYSLDGENWSVLDGVGPLAQAPGTEGYAHSDTIDFGGAMAQHVRVTVNSAQGIAPQASLSEVRFYHIPVFAREPQPADGGSAESVNTTLSWRAGREADSHEVVLSRDQAAVADGSVAAVVTQENSHTPDPLLYGETYYWQVSETNAVGTPPRHEGSIWSFMAPDYQTIDDFESYADREFLEIWATWIDGFGDPGNGATVGNGNEPETSIVFEGGKSMPIHYDNSAAPISATTRTFDTALDWTVGSPTNLSLHLRGIGPGGEQPANDAQPIYAVITDSSGRSATISYKGGDATATLSTAFESWIIPLADLAPVSLSSIASITIGVGTPGGAPSGATGTVYVDLLRVGVGTAVVSTQPTVRTEKASYSPNEPIVVHFTNAAGNTTVDWVAFFVDGDPSQNYIDFIYLDGVTDGSLTYDAGLPTPGTYNVRLLFNDSYIVEASNVFTVE